MCSSDLLPTALVEILKKSTDNVSGFVAEAVAERIRHDLLGEELRLYQEEYGAFTEEELAEARAEIFGALGMDTGQDQDSARAA